MRIDLPICNFKNCKWESDCNCTNSQNGYNTCEYILLNKTLEKSINYK